ncbi:hypothetical protein OJF2_02440 [Aquisphaera giovannonii]|uniref:Chromosome partition protein Smc n=1 Tax=Aquisphaera giovannonii TaxID=406548 RepID=A0A5B9VUK1_9BACT|nr:hypothetical protein [Aquisphaera giovannonii]QEH31779.1 hypothetical protein OJF2_02440 [Aquisphaera giovannonii]
MNFRSIPARRALMTLAVAGLAAYASAFSLAQQMARPVTVPVPAGGSAVTIAPAQAAGDTTYYRTYSDDVLAPAQAAGTALFRAYGEAGRAWSPVDLARHRASSQLSAKEASIAQEADSLARQLESADSDAKRSDLKAKLSEALGKQFDLRQERHQKEIEALEAQVKKLKDLVDKRKENRSEIISRRLDQVVRDAQGLGF